jgi:tetrahydromethanopterin S-methyltransferase subunit D
MPVVGIEKTRVPKSSLLFIPISAFIETVPIYNVNENRDCPPGTVALIPTACLFSPVFSCIFGGIIFDLYYETSAKSYRAAA